MRIRIPVAVVLGLALQAAAVHPAGAEVRIRPSVEPTPMPLVEITGTTSAPQLISAKQSGTTFYKGGGAAGVLLPMAPAAGVVEFHFACLSSGSITILPFGDNVIEVGDGASGSGLGVGTGDGGYVTITGEGSVVTLRSAGAGIYAVSAGAGVVAFGDNYGVAPAMVRGSMSGLRQAVTRSALELSTAAAASAPAAHELGLSFAAGADHDAPALFILPADWDDGIEADRDTVSIALHWAKTTSAAGAVKWQTRYRLASTTRILSAWSSWADASSVASDGDTADLQAINLSADISVANTARVPARAIAVQVRRQGSSGSDTYGAAAVLLAIQLRYSTDIAGERSDLSK